jgi:glutaminase
MGIGVFSPRLDEKGNSILGVRMMEALNKELELNIFR